MAYSQEPDMELINELFEDIERNPPGIEAQKLLINQYIAANWIDAIPGAVEELRRLCKNDPEIDHWHAAYCQGNPKQRRTSVRAAVASSSSTAATASKRMQTFDLPTRLRKTLPIFSKTRSPGQRTQSRHVHTDSNQLVDSYASFRQKANALLSEMRLLQNLQFRKGKQKAQDDNLDMVEALADGRITSVLNGHSGPPTQKTAKPKVAAPDNARTVARRMAANPGQAFDIVMSDLEELYHWLPSSSRKVLDSDSLRDQLAKRVQNIIGCLSPDLQIHPQMALMHMDHEVFGRNYENTETMLGDEVTDIPRERFYVTEDNYAWDMDELQQAISSQGGVMRNPITKHMFTPKDVHDILQHPLGQSLGALQVEQRELKKGVRPRTIDEMSRISAILLEDMAEDALKSRQAVDEFMAYIATLPQKEQKAINNLRVPARDSHTRQAFDGSIGDTIRDAKGNKLCFHKAGDFIQQAATYLRR